MRYHGARRQFDAAVVVPSFIQDFILDKKNQSVTGNEWFLWGGTRLEHGGSIPFKQQRLTQSPTRGAVRFLRKDGVAAVTKMASVSILL